MDVPEYIRKIENGSVLKYHTNLARKRCMESLDLADEMSEIDKKRWCTNNLGYFIVTQPHMMRTQEIKLEKENYKPSTKKGCPLAPIILFIILILFIFLAYNLLKK